MIYYILLLAAGVLQGVMVSFNGQLGNYYSLFGITLFVHGIALVMLLVYLLGIRREKIRLRGAPWYVYLVGLFGIGIVSSSSWCTIHVGAAAMTALSTAGELLAARAIDAFGWFGMPRTRFSPRQLPGYMLVAAGVVLVMLAQ